MLKRKAAEEVLFVSKKIALYLVALAAMAAGSGCSHSDSLEKRFHLQGKVVSVTADAHQALISHGSIPGFMGAMTMPYIIREDAILQAIKPGDKIEAEIVVTDGGAHLEHLQIVNPEPAGSEHPHSKPGNSQPAAPQAAAEPALRRPQPGEKMPPFHLITQSGEKVDNRSTGNQALLITFIYTRCPLPDFCPLLNNNFSQIARTVELEKDKYPPLHLLSVSIDPEHDTPAVLKQYAARYSAFKPGLWDFATGKPQDIRSFATSFGVSYWTEDFQVMHSMLTTLIDPQGNITASYSGNQWKPEDVLHDLQQLHTTPPPSKKHS